MDKELLEIYNQGLDEYAEAMGGENKGELLEYHPMWIGSFPFSTN